MAANAPGSGWQQVWDENYKRHYYFNVLTGESSWIDPHTQHEPSVPPLVLTPTSAGGKKRGTVPGADSTPSPRSISRGKSPIPSAALQSPRSPRSPSLSARSQSPRTRPRTQSTPDKPTFKPAINALSRKMVNRTDAISSMYEWNEQKRERIKKLKEEYAANEMKEVLPGKQIKLQPVCGAVSRQCL